MVPNSTSPASARGAAGRGRVEQPADLRRRRSRWPAAVRTRSRNRSLARRRRRVRATSSVGAGVLPDDRVVHRLAGAAVPQHVVSRWLVMPIAARSARAEAGPVERVAGRTACTLSQISAASCSTQPGRGKICRARAGRTRRCGRRSRTRCSATRSCPGRSRRDSSSRCSRLSVSPMPPHTSTTSGDHSRWRPMCHFRPGSLAQPGRPVGAITRPGPEASRQHRKSWHSADFSRHYADTSLGRPAILQMSMRVFRGSVPTTAGARCDRINRHP